MPADWLAQAAAMPVAFAQVREDPRVDHAVLDLLGRPAPTGLMVASGGCTAADVVGRFARLRLVDINPAQLALTRLKLHLLQHAATGDRLQLMGHAPMPGRAAVLGPLLDALGVGRDVLGPFAQVAALGPDHAGRYELNFAQLRREMADLDWPALLTAPDAAARVAPGTPAGDAMDRAFDSAMSLENLVALFGHGATQNRVEPFGRHFARRTRHATATLPTAVNPYLWQLLVGRFPPGVAYPWFAAPAPAAWPDLTFTRGPMADALAAARDPYDFVHLSNVLDWLTPAEAADTLRRAARALRPGGLVVVRQLNSSSDLPACGPDFDWLDTAALHAADRSFFYRLLHVGRRR